MRLTTDEIAMAHVRYVHVRCAIHDAPDSRVSRVTAQFGATIALAKRAAGGWWYAWSVCSAQDQFSKKRGRQIARGRLFASSRKRLETKRGWTGCEDFVNAVDDAADMLYEQLVVSDSNPRYWERRALQTALFSEVARMRSARDQKAVASAN